MNASSGNRIVTPLRAVPIALIATLVTLGTMPLVGLDGAVVIGTVGVGLLIVIGVFSGRWLDVRWVVVKLRKLPSILRSNADLIRSPQIVGRASGLTWYSDAKFVAGAIATLIAGIVVAAGVARLSTGSVSELPVATTPAPSLGAPPSPVGAPPPPVGTTGSITHSNLVQSCTSTGELCDPPYELRATPTRTSITILSFRFTSTNCSSIRLHVFLNGQPIAVSDWLGWTGSPAPGPTFSILNPSFSFQFLGPFGGGVQTVDLRAEGQISGCNQQGSLTGWMGRLDVTSDATVTGGAA